MRPGKLNYGKKYKLQFKEPILLLMMQSRREGKNLITPQNIFMYIHQDAMHYMELI